MAFPLSGRIAASLVLAAVWATGATAQEQPRRTGTVLTDVVPVQPEWQDGYLLAPTRPGLGIEFDREAAKQHPFQMAELPQLRRLDGSFTNW